MKIKLSDFIKEKITDFKEAEVITVIDNNTGKACRFIGNVTSTEGLHLHPYGEMAKLTLQADKESFYSVIDREDNESLLNRLKQGEKINISLSEGGFKMSMSPGGRFDLYRNGDIIFNCGRFSHLLLRVNAYAEIL